MSTPRNSNSLMQPARVLPFAYPLDEFYALASRALPSIEQVRGDEVPEPQRTLLVHTNDMTPTLEEFYGEEIHLKVLSRNQRGNFYFREVVLITARTHRAIEFGAIKINLDLFPIPARPRILEEQQPLGGILRDHKISHVGRPKAYLRVRSDAFISDALHLKGEQVLYGRRNTLFDPQQRALAEIVEILPPHK